MLRKLGQTRMNSYTLPEFQRVWKSEVGLFIPVPAGHLTRACTWLPPASAHPSLRLAAAGEAWALAFRER
jgi:hypothetical protein